MKRIIFNLKREWYDKIASGEKTVEYRNVSLHWRRRLGINPLSLKLGPVKMVGFEAVFRVGYPSNYKPRKWPDIVRRITKIDIGPCPYDGWNGNYFRIYFEKLASDITPSDLVKQPDEIMREDRRAEHSEEI